MSRFYAEDAVQTYVYRDFPEMQDYVALRSFEAPFIRAATHSESGPAEEERRVFQFDLIEKFEEKILADIKGQMPRRLRHEIRKALNEVMNLPKSDPLYYGSGPIIHRAEFIQMCLSPVPALVDIPARISKSNPRGHHFYYITAFSPYWTGPQINEVLTRTENDNPDLPEHFEETVRIMKLAQQYGIIAQRHHYPEKREDKPVPSDGKIKSISEVFGFACALTFMGQAALPTLRHIAKWAPSNTYEQPNINGTLMKEVLKPGSGLYDRLGARDVLAYADSLCNKLHIK